MPQAGVRFEGVTFHYPGYDEKVLDEFDLDIPAGSSLAIVGQNGAGKTTLAKLLCRLYDPVAGRVSVDNVPVPNKISGGISLRNLNFDYPGTENVVLDEPTAAFDAETEHELFQQYTAAARSKEASNGRIAVLVSHRFSTVRMADQIVVLDGAKLVETESHEELMANGGQYAELFYTIQAEAYR